MIDIFKLRENTYNLRNFEIFESQNHRTKKLDLDSIAYRASQLWKKKFFFNNFFFPFSIKNTTNNKTQELFTYKKK